MRSSPQHLPAAVALVALCFLVQGCDFVAPKTTAKLRAAPHAKPVLAALEKYYQDHTQYPLALTNLYPKYLATNVPLELVKGRYLEWSFVYHCTNSTNYELMWAGGSSFAIYRNGKLVGNNSNPFR